MGLRLRQAMQAVQAACGNSTLGFSRQRRSGMGAPVCARVGSRGGRCGRPHQVRARKVAMLRQKSWRAGAEAEPGAQYGPCERSCVGPMHLPPSAYARISCHALE